MMERPQIDETILDGIPAELIRPLLAIHMRLHDADTIENLTTLLKDIDLLIPFFSQAGGNSFYYTLVHGTVQKFLRAANAAEAWAQRKDTTARCSGLTLSRLRVDVTGVQGEQRLFISYHRTGQLHMETMEEAIDLVVTEAPEDEL